MSAPKNAKEGATKEAKRKTANCAAVSAEETRRGRGRPVGWRKPDAEKRTEHYKAMVRPGQAARLDALLAPGQSRADFLEALPELLAQLRGKG